MRLLDRLRRGRRGGERPRQLEGEEYEIERAEREALKARDRYAESLVEKAGHARYPFLEDPFE